MRTIHYSIRLVIMLCLISLTYWVTTSLFQQAVQIPVLVTLLIVTPGIERLWALLEWMSPVIGSVDLKEQRRTQKRIVEHQLARSLRYGSRLVVAVIREKRRISSHVLEQNLRETDIVLRDASGYLLALMPDTTIEQANIAFKRLMSVVPLKDVVVMDESMLRAAISAQGIDSSRAARSVAPGYLRQMCTRILHQKLASLPFEEIESEAAVYPLFEGEELEQQPGLYQQSQIQQGK